MRVKGVTQTRVSPDGLRAVYMVREAVMTDDKSEYVTQLHLASCDGSDSYPLTFGEKSSSDPQWSPDGKYIAFLSKRGETQYPSKHGDAGKDKNNLFLLRVTGGEAERLTDVKTDIANFAWSPDSAQIAFALPDPPTEEEAKRNKGKDDWMWIEEDVKMTRLRVISIAAPVDAQGRRASRALTPASLNVSGGFKWSPDGNSVVFAHTLTPSANDWVTSALSVVDVPNDSVQSLVSGGGAASQPHFSPDGKLIAFTLSDDPPHWAGYSRVHVVPSEGGDRAHSRPLRRQPQPDRMVGGRQAGDLHGAAWDAGRSLRAGHERRTAFTRSKWARA